ncbi:hypothetical protein [Bacillus cereus group sp. BfR-BA-01382]|uniref:hypothetical protein n=1 Tax=Bacillus cereus group sp. BfR-BA-01382 TaxID=2920326 RepID=UPI001F57F8EE
MNKTAKRCLLGILSIGVLAISVGCGNNEEEQKSQNTKLTQEQLQKVLDSQNKKKDKTEENKDDNSKEKEKPKLEKDKFINEVNLMMGGEYIKKIDVADAHATLTYYDSYQAVVSENSSMKDLKEETYKEYWSTGDKIDKLFVIETTRLFKKNPALENLEVILPFEGKTYEASINKKELEKVLKVKMDTLNESTNWKEFTDKYAYGLDNVERQKVFKHFVTIE